MAWTGSTAWIPVSQPGSRSGGKLSGLNIRTNTTSTWLIMFAAIGGRTDAIA
jgi:TRAP-type C4-dicarboxylate transport system substrate-binding protein